MKIRATLDIEVAMGGVSHNGTGLQGYLPYGTRYEEIVRVFGSPQQRNSLDGKIKLEWVGRICGLIFTIYDYKSGVNPKNNTDWHIGGRLKLTADVLNAYFQSVQSKQTLPLS